MHTHKPHIALTDHLGNTRAIFGDYLLGSISAAAPFVVTDLHAHQTAMYNYYAFGSPKPNTYSTTTNTITAQDQYYDDPEPPASMVGVDYKYRYGFNGQEKDDEIKGKGNSLSFDLRIYDSRLGRFLSVDPLSHSYPYYTPYQFAGNTPIRCIDVEGGEPLDYTYNWVYTINAGVVKTEEGLMDWNQIYDKVTKQYFIVMHKSNDYSQYYFMTTPKPGSNEPVNKIDPKTTRMKAFETANQISQKAYTDFCNAGAMAPTVVIGGGAALLLAAETGLLPDLISETAKEAIANRGDLSKMDLADIGTGTLTSKLGFGGKAIHALSSTCFDFSEKDGFKTVFDQSKKGNGVAYEGYINILQETVSGCGKLGGVSESTLNLIDVGIDQLKTEINDNCD